MDYQTAMDLHDFAGFRVIRTKGHIVRKDSEGRTITCAATPSDSHAGDNAVRVLCKTLGKTKAELLHDFNERTEGRRAGGESPKDFDRRHAPAPELLDIVQAKFANPVLVESNSARIRRERFVRKQKQDERKLVKIYAQEAEAKRQHELLRDSFKEVVRISHDLLDADLNAAGGNWASVYEHAAGNAAADCSTVLRLRGFRTRLVMGTYARDGQECGWFFAVEVCGFYLDIFTNYISDTPRWELGTGETGEIVAECIHEYRLTHNKDFTQWRVGKEWRCDRCKQAGAPSSFAQVNTTILCKSCYKVDPREMTAECEAKEA
jgi:hypothetical protein